MTRLPTFTLAAALTLALVAIMPAPVAPAPQSAPSAAALRNGLYVVSHVDLVPDALAAGRIDLAVNGTGPSAIGRGQRVRVTLTPPKG